MQHIHLKTTYNQSLAKAAKIIEKPAPFQPIS